MVIVSFISTITLPNGGLGKPQAAVFIHQSSNSLSSNIEKTRYFVMHTGHGWEIDVFEGENAGLTVAEIELTDPNEPFELPAWVAEEISHDPRYYNVCLVKNPYKIGVLER